MNQKVADFKVYVLSVTRHSMPFTPQVFTTVDEAQAEAIRHGVTGPWDPVTDKAWLHTAEDGNVWAIDIVSVEGDHHEWLKTVWLERWKDDPIFEEMERAANDG